MPEIKAIETRYNGHRFRSRLEARWAVFFDGAKIRYEYEPEGFATADGLCYLPDFYLPDSDVYVEVKPPRPGYLEEMKKAEKMVGIGGLNKLLVLQNIPPKTEFDFYWYPMLYHHPLSDFGETDIALVCFEPLCGEDGDYIPYLQVCYWTPVSRVPIYHSQSPYAAIHDSKIAKLFPLVDMTYGEHLSGNAGLVKSYNSCYDKARQARFEHGERG